MMESAIVYDEIEYPAYSYPQIHPDRLATIARLHGMAPAPPDRCRLLELGCGCGSNLIPMALGLPESRFLGIDLASTQISKGRRQIARLGLANIRMDQLDIQDFSEDQGLFDYIVAHGLYSWVSETVQEKIFGIIEKCLSPEGVAYVSYNTLPGGHLRLMVREMLLYHCSRFDSARQKIEEARFFAELIAKSQIRPNSYGSLLQQERERVFCRHPHVLFHDELAECNSNVYFHQFMTQAAHHHLQFLSEADPRDVQPTANIEPSAVALLKKLGSETIAGQQYLDFFLGRRFRQTLLCHSSVAIDRTVTVDRITNLLVAANAKPTTSSLVDASDSEVLFSSVDSKDESASITTSHPLMKAVMVCLEDVWPLPISFQALWDAAHNLLLAWNPPKPFDSCNEWNCLAKMLFVCYQAGLVELHSWKPHLTSKPGKWPLASPFARLQSLEGDLITTLRHDQVQIHQAVNKKLLQLLDGTRDRSMILHDLQEAVLASQSPENGGPELNETAKRTGEMLDADLDRHLEDFGRLGLLVS
ncbi:MAG TPA: hypothetical protein DCR97_10000 [Deltaproteobacteria bacterium]|nr:hypothetical protein [Deltaproteobacteria bacterium]